MSPDIPAIAESIVLFDGVCGLCNGLVRFIAHHDRDRRFRFASLQSPAGQAILRMYSLPGDRLDTFYLIRGEFAYARSEAALGVARHLSFPWWLLSGLGVLPMFLRDLLYGLIARHRYAILGTTEYCALPDPELLRRFIE